MTQLQREHRDKIAAVSRRRASAKRPARPVRERETPAETRYDLVGVIHPPGHWSYYVLRDTHGRPRLVYEGELRGLSARGRVPNCDFIHHEKKAFDDYSPLVEIRTWPADLLERNAVRLSWAEYNEKNIDRTARRLCREFKK